MIDPRWREQLRLAKALHEQLRQPSLPSVFPPWVAWEHVQRACSRLNIARQRGWQAAGTAAVHDLERTIGALQRQLEACTRDTRTSTGNPIASPRDILGDLDALDDEFPEVRWDLRSKTLSVVTEPIQLDGIELGRFEIVLRYLNLGLSRPYRVIALDPNPAVGDEHTPHPHVRNDDLCEGDGKAPLQQALKQGRFFDVFVLIRQILQTYNADSAYVPLKNWEGIQCPDCGTTVNADDTSCCESCHSDCCSECSSSCSKCDSSLCSSCQDRCADCGDTSCSGCMKTCAGCEQAYCAACLKNNRCDDCQEIDDAEDQETSDPEPSNTALQPVCLGEAVVPQGSGSD